MSKDSGWPELPYGQWAETCETLYRWTQVIGKVQLTLTPRVNHWWNVTLHVTARGLITPAIPYDHRCFDIEFDFLEHRLLIRTSDGAQERIALEPKSVAAFYVDVMDRLQHLGINVHIWTMPSEIENAVPFDHDVAHAQYDQAWVERFCQVLQSSDRVLKSFRAKFIGKVSPVHFFWGGFDLAVTRFSGRPAPPLPRGAPNVAAWVMQEAYSHEVSSCGFWPGNGGYGTAAFYAYAYPEPPAYGRTSLQTPGAYYDGELSQFILPYDAVRRSRDPDTLLSGFLQETYEAAADQAQWERKLLEWGSHGTETATQSDARR
jgi:hypothetical protein